MKSFADAFLPVQNLKRLNIFNNYKLFSSYFYNSHTGPALSSLSDTIMDIEFGSNVFTAVPWDALQDLNETLTVLKLDNNIFTELGTGESGVGGISGLFNRVPGGKDTFPLMTKLIELNLDDCRIQHIHEKAFHNLKSLQDLSLKYNYLYAIPDAVAAIPSLNTFSFAAGDGAFDSGVK